MAEFNISTIDKKQPHLYLARMQGTRKAILPVHTPAEHNQSLSRPYEIKPRFQHTVIWTYMETCCKGVE
jgi:hypothetical protein